jgi:2-amino-4-hydroxy-6-hydroxymethyldihydropteridine diphosphokinase
VARAFLSLGSNLGDCLEHLKYGVSRLGSALGAVRRCSGVYLTEPVDAPAQPDYYNLVVECETELSPEEVLKAASRIEEERGRVRTLERGPRTLDIDILLYEDEVRDTPELQIPHPEMERRAFVLAPLSELEPDLPLRSGVTVRERLNDTEVASQRVERLPDDVL